MISLPASRTGVQVVADRVARPDEPARLEDEDRHRGELLRDRADAEPGLRRVHELGGVVGHPEALRIEHLAVLRDERRAVEAGREPAVQLRLEVESGGRGGAGDSDRAGVAEATAVLELAAGGAVDSPGPAQAVTSATTERTLNTRATVEVMALPLEVHGDDRHASRLEIVDEREVPDLAVRRPRRHRSTGSDPTVRATTRTSRSRTHSALTTPVISVVGSIPSGSITRSRPSRIVASLTAVAGPTNDRAVRRVPGIQDGPPRRSRPR